MEPEIKEKKVLEKIIRIDQSPHWIKFLNPNFNERSGAIIGKWVYHDSPDRLAEIARSLEPQIITGLILELKYRPTPNDPQGYYAGHPPPLCIYSTLAIRTILKRKLDSMGLQGLYWRSKEETERDRPKLEQHARERMIESPLIDEI